MFMVSTGPIAIAASTTKTVIDLATPSTNVGRIVKWCVGSDATSAGTATSAIRVQLGLFNAAVTTHSAYGPWSYDGADKNAGSQLTGGINTTVEGAGTTTGVLEEHLLPLTQSELLAWEPIPFLIPVSSFWRMRIITPAGIGTTNIYATVGWTE